VQQSGGLLLTPVQTLAATLIFFRDGERKCKSSPVVFSAIFAFGELNLLCKLNWLAPAKLPVGSWGEYNLASHSEI